jgi:molybdate transport system substrate-binding protein
MVKNHKLLVILVVAIASFALCMGLAACSGSSNSTSSKTTSAASNATKVDLNGKKLKIYCGAGMTNPFAEIADAFKSSTGCEMEVVYQNAAQTQTAIKTTKEGDFFIAGSADELKPVQDFVASSTDLVKHIPVLIVPTNNPKNVKSIADLANCNTVLVGDPESTPIGKIAKTVLTNAGIWDSMQAAGKFSMTTTAPQIATALENGNGDAGIVWKENSSDKVTIVDTPEMQKAIKTIPAAQLSYCADTSTAQAFNDFLQTDTAKQIWQKYGYEIVG